MPRIPKFTSNQLERIHRLEAGLRAAVISRNYDKAKFFIHDIDSFLKSTGHKARLMKNRNLFFEAAINEGEYEVADKGLRIVIKATSDNTRIHLESLALLAICLLRQGRIDESEIYIELVLQNDSVIKSPTRRSRFRIKAIARFEEEAVFASLIDSARKEYPDPATLQDEAGILVQKNLSDQELYERIGYASPPGTKDIILRIDTFSRKRITMQEVKLLACPEEKKSSRKVGSTVWDALKRRIHAALCDPESEIYQAWTKQGMGAVINKLYIGTAITTCLVNIGAGASALAIPVIALMFKLGIETYCETQKPDMFMDF